MRDVGNVYHLQQRTIRMLASLSHSEGSERPVLHVLKLSIKIIFLVNWILLPGLEEVFSASFISTVGELTVVLSRRARRVSS